MVDHGDSQAYPDAPEPAPSLLSFDVTEADTAVALGSGDVPVLATPRLLAWCEAATCVAAAASGLVPAGGTTVGTRVELDHLRPTPVGGRVEVGAVLLATEGRALRFGITAADRSGQAVGAGTVIRVVVDANRFTGQLPAP